MAANYLVQQREVAAWVLTSAGWARGKFVVPRTHGFIETVEATPGLLKMREVQLPGTPGLLPFFGLWKEAISLIVPEVDPSAPVAAPQAGIIHNVTCLLQLGVLSGQITLRQGVRVSDHFQRPNAFIGLQDGKFQEHTEVPLTQGGMDIVYLNTRHLIGVTD